MEQDPFAGLQAFGDFCIQPITAPDGDVAPYGSAVSVNEDGPPVAVAKQCRQRELQHIVALPQHDAHIHLVTVAQSLPVRAQADEIE